MGRPLIHAGPPDYADTDPELQLRYEGMAKLNAMQKALTQIALARDRGVVRGTIWRHYKTHCLYRVLGFTFSTVEEAACVRYARCDEQGRPVPGITEFTRPLAEWEEVVEYDPEWGEVTRFWFRGHVPLTQLLREFLTGERF